MVWPSAQPKFTEELEDIEVCVGQPANLRCRVEGDPDPDIEWCVDGDKIKKGGRFDFLTEGDLVTLRITETSAEDEGEYKCTATNENGTATTSAELIVNGELLAEKYVLCFCSSYVRLTANYVWLLTHVGCDVIKLGLSETNNHLAQIVPQECGSWVIFNFDLQIYVMDRQVTVM